MRISFLPNIRSQIRENARPIFRCCLLRGSLNVLRGEESPIDSRATWRGVVLGHGDDDATLGTGRGRAWASATHLWKLYGTRGFASLAQA